MDIKKKYARYVSKNILGMIGLSCYILADSYFIVKAQGTDGLAALNLMLPLYSLIFAIGAMIGIGSAIRYTIYKYKNQTEADKYFFQALCFTGLFGGIFSAAGICYPEQILYLLGADELLMKIGISYMQIFMGFAPVFMWNHIINAYVRNDNATSIAMFATLMSSLFNIVFDYIFMFPLQMGMKGAALATALSPVIGILICLTHLLSSKSQIKIKVCKLSIRTLWKVSQLGISAFIAEMSSGVITLVYNFLILSLAGNVGVAAYGVVANISIVAISVFNGIAQGSQPLVSDCYGKGDKKTVGELGNRSFIVSVFAAFLLYTLLFFSAEYIVALVNFQKDLLFAEYAVSGIKLYFTGIFFAGLNIVGSSFFGATERITASFTVSLLRGIILIIATSLLLSKWFGMTGVWLSYVTAEFLTFNVMFFFLRKKNSI